MGTPNQPATVVHTLENSNRLLASSNYARQITIKGYARVQAVCRGTWRLPQVVTVQSVVDGIIDTNPAVGFNNDFTRARLWVRVKWSDGNVSFQKDVPANTPFVCVATTVEVSAYLKLDNRTPESALSDDFFPSTVEANLAVALLDGASAVPEARYIVSEAWDGVATLSGNLRQVPGATGFFQGELGGVGPKTVYSLTGYQESGSDLWVMLFDGSELAADYSAFVPPGPNLAIADGAMNQLYQFRVPSGEDFSVTFERGLVFQHGLAALFSTTPGVLTEALRFTFSWAANWDFADPGSLRPAGQ